MPQAWLSQERAQRGGLHNLWRAKWEGCSWDSLSPPHKSLFYLSLIPSRTLWGPPVYKEPFHVPHFLFVGKGLQLPRPSWTPKSIFKQLLIREVRECRNKGTDKQRKLFLLSRNNSAAKKQGPGSCSRDIHNNISLSSSAGTKAPIHVENVT